MRIGNKEAGLSLLQYIFSIVSTVVFTTILLNRVSDKEYAIWSIFLSIQAFVVLIDSGFGGVVLRYTSYAFCGAEKIFSSGTPEMNDNNSTNFPLLVEIIYCAKKIYRKFAMIGFSILIVATLYIYILTKELENSLVIIYSWGFFSFAVAVDMYYTYLSNIMKGMGKLYQSSIILIVVTLSDLLFKVYFILTGWGVLGLAIAYIAKIAIYRILLALYTRHLFKNQKGLFLSEKSKKHDQHNSTTYKAIIENSKQLTWVTISDYISGKGKTLLCSIFMPLSITAAFSITNQIIGIIYSIAILPHSIFRYKLGESIPRGDIKTTKDVISLNMLLFFAIMVLGSFINVIFGERLFSLIESETPLLNSWYILAIAIYQFINGILTICTNYIQYHNIQPYVRSIVISSFSGVLIAIIVLILGGGLSGYLASIIFVQILYNAWKWPNYTLKNLNLPIHSIPKRGLKYLAMILRGSHD